METWIAKQDLKHINESWFTQVTLLGPASALNLGAAIARLEDNDLNPLSRQLIPVCKLSNTLTKGSGALSYLRPHLSYVFYCQHLLW
jgi:hypothetical protein